MIFCLFQVFNYLLNFRSARYKRTMRNVVFATYVVQTFPQARCLDRFTRTKCKNRIEKSQICMASLIQSRLSPTQEPEQQCLRSGKRSRRKIRSVLTRTGYPEELITLLEQSANSEWTNITPKRIKIPCVRRGEGEEDERRAITSFINFDKKP